MFAPTSRLSSVGEMMPLRLPMCPTLGGGFCLRSLGALGAGVTRRLRSATPLAI
jgi:hypothetical protein